MYEGDLLASRRGNILFVGQKDGEFVKAREVTSNWDNSSLGYFETDNGEKYFFDGKFYRLSPKQKE